MSDETTTTLTFVPCTIGTASGYAALDTGLGYYTTEDGENPPRSYFIIHLESELPVGPSLYICDEKAVQDAITQIVSAQLTDWRLPKEDIYRDTDQTRAQVVKALRKIIEQCEQSDHDIHMCTFSLSYTIQGKIKVTALSREEACDLAEDALDEIEVDDDDEVEGFTIDEITFLP